MYLAFSVFMAEGIQRKRKGKEGKGQGREGARKGRGKEGMGKNHKPTN